MLFEMFLHSQYFPHCGQFRGSVRHLYHTGSICSGCCCIFAGIKSGSRELCGRWVQVLSAFPVHYEIPINQEQPWVIIATSRISLEAVNLWCSNPIISSSFHSWDFSIKNFSLSYLVSLKISLSREDSIHALFPPLSVSRTISWCPNNLQRLPITF